MLKLFTLLTALLVLLAPALSPAAAAQQPAAACDPARPVEAGSIAGTLESQGRERLYDLYLPSAYDGTTPLPVVMGLHGFASNPAQQGTFDRYDALAEAEGFISVHPSGTGAPRRWNAGGSFDGTTEADRVDDVAFFSDLLDALEATYCIDSTRIYISGLSNGGGMSHRLACTLADRVAAIGGVAGAYSLPAEDCTPSRPVPVIAVHGELDPIVPYEGGEAGNGFAFPSIESWAADWAARNDCDTPLITEIPEQTLILREWTDCAEGTEVVLYTLPDGGHTWPGGLVLPGFIVGPTRLDIDASVIFWDFFQRHTLPSA